MICLAKKIIFLVASLLLINNCQIEGQTYYGTIYATTQAKLDTLTKYEYLTGSLILGPQTENAPCDIKDLSAFSKLKGIRGNLKIQNTMLKDFHHLDSVQYIDGNQFYVAYNDSLESFEGLENLRYLHYAPFGGGLQVDITYNPKLIKLTQFNYLDTIPLNLFINHNGLQSLDGLEHITTILGSLFLFHNQLKNIKGLKNLVDIENKVIYIDSEPELTSLEGLEKVVLKERGHFTLSNCPKVKNFNPLSTWQTNKTWTEIINNDSLLDISGLKMKDWFFSLKIKDNELLQRIDFNFLDSCGLLEIRNNANLQSIQLDSLKYGVGNDIRDNPRIKELIFPLYGLSEPLAPLGTLSFPINIAGGFLIMNNDSLLQINFPKLQYHFRGLSILDNDRLKKVSAPKAIDAQGVSLSGNPQLDFVDMKQLKVLDELWLQYNGFKKIDGFDSLYQASIRIEDSLFVDSITSFAGLRKSKYLNFYLVHDSLEYINDFPLLDTMEAVGFYLRNTNQIINFKNLKYTDVLGFITDKMKYVPFYIPELKSCRRLSLWGSPTLESVDSLYHIIEITQEAYFRDNPLLSDCSALCLMVQNGVDSTKFTFINNHPACMSIAAACDTTTVSVTNTPQEEALKNGLSLTVYPNPVSDKLTCTIEADDAQTVNISLCDLTGREIYGKESLLLQGVNILDLNVSNWGKGIYLLKVKGEKGASVLKILVE
jgi:Secretion system C-terminal sorting domain/Receptor L domain